MPIPQNNSFQLRIRSLDSDVVRKFIEILAFEQDAAHDKKAQKVTSSVMMGQIQSGEREVTSVTSTRSQIIINHIKKFTIKMIEQKHGFPRIDVKFSTESTNKSNALHNE